MPKKKPKVKEPELEITTRDYVMARLASARAAAQQSIASIDEALHLFNNPDDDKSGDEREASIDEALEAMGFATRALEAAEHEMEEIDPKEGEPWDDGDDAEEDEDAEEDDDDEDDDEDGDDDDAEEDEDD